MSDTGEPTYAAVVTISMKDGSAAAELSLTLSPADPIALADGRVKPLQDCTLEELHQFADSIEQAAWRDYWASRLDDLVENGHVELSVILPGEPDTLPFGQAAWLEHAVVLPDPALADAPEDISSERDRQPGADRSEEAERAETPVETAPESPGGGLDAADEDLELTVSEAEPVHRERESPVTDELEAPTAAVEPELRILGRRRPVGHPTWTAADILMNEPAFRNAQAHAMSRVDREVAGVLVGLQPEKQPDGRYLVHISDIIVAKHTRMQGASVTYTPESWRYVNDRLAELYPDDEAIIVGWYHTHPGFGIFLSNMDQFIHRNFFTQKWHVALVLDPIARRSGFFCWDRPQDDVKRYDFPWPPWAEGSW